MAVDPCILANPDVSGVGVRAAIYAQNLTCFLPVIVHLWDRKISRDELNGIRDQSIGMLAVAFAILFTAIILAKGAGGNQTITSYHAAVVLDLSWMNNTSTWIWCILYVHYRSKRDDQPTGANWSEWRDALLEPARKLPGRNAGAGASTEKTSIGERIRGIAQQIWRFISGQPVLSLGSIHLSLMAAVGIWLWSDPTKFGHPLDTGCDPTLTVVGVPARFSSKPLRIASLIMYSIVLIPGLNLIPPFVFFLTLHISYNWCRRWYQSPSSDIELQASRSSLARQDANGPNLSSTADHGAQPQPSDSSPSLPSSDIELQPPRSSSASQDSNGPKSPSTSNGVQPKTSDSSPHMAFLIVGLALLVAINILFIVDIELTLGRNKTGQNGDNEWGFGQVLALLLLIIPLRDAWGALQDIRARLKGVQEQFEELLRRECQATPVVEELKRLIRKGADPKLWTHDSRFGNSLQLVACYGKIELVQLLLKVGSVVLDEVGGDYGTALCAACATGKVEVVMALLRAGARRNGDGEHFGAPLHVAVLMQNREMVELLIGDNPNDANCTWEGVGTAVDVAGYMENRPLFDLLRRKGMRGRFDRYDGYHHRIIDHFVSAATCRHVPPSSILDVQDDDDSYVSYYDDSSSYDDVFFIDARDRVLQNQATLLRYVQRDRVGE